MERKYLYFIKWHFEGEEFQRRSLYYHVVVDLFSALSSISTFIPEGAILDYFRMELIENG